LVFTANPEDYTARGKIITPLKDRMGAEIRTHYPATVAGRHGDHRAGSVDQARGFEAANGRNSRVISAKMVEEDRVSGDAKTSASISRSGVSQRLPISGARERG
jgi:magnesium chelatase subunit I